VTKYKVKLDRGNKYTKAACSCDVCGKMVTANKNMWEVTAFKIEDSPIERERYLTNDYFCSKECANLFILKEM
jgi:hypothetical protein